MGKREDIRKVVIAMGDEIVKITFLERSGVCTSHGEESRDNITNGLETRHVVYRKSFGCGYMERTQVAMNLGAESLILPLTTSRFIPSQRVVTDHLHG